MYMLACTGVGLCFYEQAYVMLHVQLYTYELNCMCDTVCRVYISVAIHVCAQCANCAGKIESIDTAIFFISIDITEYFIVGLLHESSAFASINVVKLKKNGMFIKMQITATRIAGQLPSSVMSLFSSTRTCMMYLISRSFVVVITHHHHHAWAAYI